MTENPQSNWPKSENPRYLLDYAGILHFLPHRSPFLFLDGILSFEAEKKITGAKMVSFNEPYFAGHFPSEPVMPGVLQIEAMAQLSCMLIYLSYPNEAVGKRPAFAAVDEAKFRRPVRPGMELILEAELDKYRRGFAIVHAKALVGTDIVSEAVIKAAMI